MNRIMPNTKTILLLLAAIPAFCNQARGGDSLSVSGSAFAGLYPMGPASFADTVLSYDPGALGTGTGDEPEADYMNARAALGPPDASGETGFVSLGRGGSMVLGFTDNILIDGPGPDLAVTEIAPGAEAVHVWVSSDGQVFQRAGRITREEPFVDIAPVSRPDAGFTFVKLRDDMWQEQDSGPAPGADIDAVGALHTAILIRIPVRRLFHPGTMNLTDQAGVLLSAAADRIRSYPEAVIRIYAFTDDRVSYQYSMLHSQEWAGKVRDYFLNHESLSGRRFRAMGMGGKNPLVSNDTDAGRQTNRRIEIWISTD